MNSEVLEELAAMQRRIQEEANQLVMMGYRRVSNRYLTVARIDRPDYLEFLAETCEKAPADFMLPKGRKVSGQWDDFYRRVYSKDKLEVSPEVFKLIPSSGHCQTGYLR